MDVDREIHTVSMHSDDPVMTAIEKYKTHPSITKIAEEDLPHSNFDFRDITKVVMLKAIENLAVSKSFPKDNIPPKIIMKNKDIFSKVLTNDIRKCIENCIFPVNLKNADIFPLFKKLDRLSKNNYRPVSILPTLSKLYEKILYIQIYNYFDNIFSKYLCGFRKGHSTQHCLLFMLENLRKALDNRLKTGILLTDLSKAFASISHDLLIAKLHAYGISRNALTLVYDYLSGRKQRTKVGDTFSTWRYVIYGVPQGSILGPLLFNIYINDLFLFSADFNITNYADDCSPFEFNGTINNVILKLENDAIILMHWFKNNYMKLNPDKCRMILSDKDHNLNISLGNELVSNSECEKILGIHFDSKLDFNTHVTKLCSKVGQKLHALARISNFMSTKQKLLIMNAFISSQFGYCPLIWMCHSRALNTRINRIHERALRIVYNDNSSSFDTLLGKSGQVKIHQKSMNFGC